MSRAILFCEKHQIPKIHQRDGYICPPCRRESSKAKKVSHRTHEARKARRVDWFSANGPCRHCGSPENLELDHIDPATKDPRLRVASVHIWGWKQEDRERELAKCQPLCKTCHAAKTLLERGGPQRHGKAGMYT